MTPTSRPVRASGRAAARAAGPVALLVAAAGVTACGQQPPATSGSADVAGAGSGTTTDDTATSDRARVVRLAAGDPRPRLVCPSDARSVMIADFAHGAKGAATPEEAVGPPDLVRAGEQLVLSRRGRTAWVLRGDGTARMEIGLLHQSGWLLHRRTSCG